MDKKPENVAPLREERCAREGCARCGHDAALHRPGCDWSQVQDVEGCGCPGYLLAPSPAAAESVAARDVQCPACGEGFDPAGAAQWTPEMAAAAPRYVERVRALEAKLAEAERERDSWQERARLEAERAAGFDQIGRQAQAKRDEALARVSALERVAKEANFHLEHTTCDHREYLIAALDALAPEEPETKQGPENNDA